MPRVKIDYIVSFSSEDPDHPASNLLSWEFNKKRWLCPKGETSCSVVLQLTKAVKISALNIGAHNTAFVEVLVGRSEKPNEPFQVLVPSSVFLSPAESRRGDCERVRSFSGLGEVAAQRWDRLRLVCSQPYNRHCQFGLSFVEISEPEGSGPAPVKMPAIVRAGSSDEEESFRPGELFASIRSQTPGKTPADTGTQIRHATSQALKNISDSATKLVKTPISKNNRTAPTSSDYGTDRQRNDLMYTDDDDKPHAKIDHVVKRHKDDKIKEEATSDKKKRKEMTLDKEPSSSKKVKHSVNIKNTSFDVFLKDPEKEITSDHGNKQEKLIEDNRNNAKIDSYQSKNTSYDSFHKESKTNRSHSADRRKNEPTTSKRAEDSGKAEDNSTRKESRKKEFRESMSNAPSTSDGARPNKRTQKSSEGGTDSPLRGVVLSLSGYANPERGDLRRIALALGAHVRPDWGPGCNLLVCAFPNTPKLRQVRAQEGGERVPVVMGEWLREAERTHRRPQWEPFATEPQRRKAAPHTDSGEGEEQAEDTESDTDDEIEKVMHSTKKPHPTASPSPSSSFSEGGDTEPESEVERVERIEGGRSLPPLFEGRTFAGGDALCARYVRAYGGLHIPESEVDEESAVDYVLSGSCPGTRVSPAWLWRCHASKRILPVPD